MWRVEAGVQGLAATPNTAAAAAAGTLRWFHVLDAMRCRAAAVCRRRC